MKNGDNDSFDNQGEIGHRNFLLSIFFAKY